MSGQLLWGHAGFSLEFTWSAESPIVLSSARTCRTTAELAHTVPLIEILSASAGHVLASDRLNHTVIGADLRYRSHSIGGSNALPTLTFVTISETFGVEAQIRLEMPAGVASVRAVVTVTNTGDSPLVLRSVTSWSFGFSLASQASGLGVDGWHRVSGLNDWLGEGRWSTQPLRGHDFPQLAEDLTGHDPRGEYRAVSTGTWSTGRQFPVAAIEHRESAVAWAWQIEHNGAWRWEIGEDTDGGYVSLAGPTEVDAAWTKVLAPGESFHSVPATVSLGSGYESAIAALTDFRRATRRDHPDNTAMTVVFNDYMNTLNGDPTTEKLLPLIAAAAEAGAEVFCIDAGWYDDSGHWWDSVGEWLPSTTRFNGGLHTVVDAITSAGMVPGLWLEPEVVGVRSAMADKLPLEAFLLRHGQRVVEHGRYHLDLRHPETIRHLDAVVDRLVSEFGIGFFKLDYNINPGAGTDHDSDSLGDGLLEHNRAHLAWLDSVLDRHPGLVIENCSSGAMRTDFAMLSRIAMQSTSDQQDFTKYPPIAASAPMSMLPEQAANWAYPQPEMTQEEVAFCLATGLLGRYYLSGYLNRMNNDQRELVAEAVRVAKELRPLIQIGHASWPLGLPGWTDPWVALALTADGADTVTLWKRDHEDTVSLSFPHYLGLDITIETVFPSSLEPWHTSWDATSGILTVQAVDTAVAARTLRLQPVSP